MIDTHQHNHSEYPAIAMVLAILSISSNMVAYDQSFIAPLAHLFSALSGLAGLILFGVTMYEKFFKNKSDGSS